MRRSCGGGLSAAERAAAGTWLDRLRDAARQRDRIAEYHSGDPRFDLETADIRRLIEESLEGLVREHALALLEESADETLTDCSTTVRCGRRLTGRSRLAIT